MLEKFRYVERTGDEMVGRLSERTLLSVVCNSPVDYIQAHGDPACEQVLLLECERVELTSVCVTDKAFEPNRTEISPSADNFQSLGSRANHGLRGDGLPDQDLTRRHDGRLEIEIFGDGDHAFET